MLWCFDEAEDGSSVHFVRWSLFHTHTHARNAIESCHVYLYLLDTHTHTHTVDVAVDEFCFNSASWLQFLIKIVYARKRSARYSICICICTTKPSSLLLFLWFGESRVADCNYCNRVSNRSNPIRCDAIACQSIWPGSGPVRTLIWFRFSCFDHFVIVSSARAP